MKEFDGVHQIFWTVSIFQKDLASSLKRVCYVLSQLRVQRPLLFLQGSGYLDLESVAFVGQESGQAGKAAPINHLQYLLSMLQQLQLASEAAKGPDSVVFCRH